MTQIGYADNQQALPLLSNRHACGRFPRNYLVKDSEMEGWLPAKKQLELAMCKTASVLLASACQIGGPGTSKDSHGGNSTSDQGVYERGFPSKAGETMPIIVFVFIMAQAFGDTHTDAEMATTDMITIAFFLLLRTSKYTGTMSDDSAFKLRCPPVHPMLAVGFVSRLHSGA
jgi:hypothetical protein